MKHSAIQFLFILSFIPFGLASAGENPNRCDPSFPPEIQIENCTDWLATGTLNDQEMSIAHGIRGYAHAMLGDTDAALTDLEQAAGLNPFDPEITNTRGVILMQLGDFGRAIDDFTAALRVYPEMMFAYSNRCWAFFESGLSEKAIEDCEKAIELVPDNSVPYNNLAMAKYRVREFSVALEAIEHALSLSPGSWQYLNTRGHILAALNEPEAAMRDFDQAAVGGGGEIVSEYQRALIRNEYYGGPVDGVYSPETRAAIETCVQAGCGLLDPDPNEIAAARKSADREHLGEVYPGSPKTLVDCAVGHGFMEDGVMASSGNDDLSLPPNLQDGVLALAKGAKVISIIGPGGWTLSFGGGAPGLSYVKVEAQDEETREALAQAFATAFRNCLR